MRTIFTYLILCAVFSIHAFAAKTIDLNQIDKSTLEQAKNKFAFLNKKELTREDLEQFIKWLVEENYYDSAQYVSEDTQHYIVKVTRTKRVDSINVTGNASISESNILKELRISENSKFDQDTLIDGADHIKLLYRDYGFLNASVDVEYAPNKKNNVDIKVKIQENKQTLFNQFKIETISAELKNNIEKITSKKVGVAFTPANLKILQSDLRMYLKEHQHYKAELSEPILNFSKDASEVIVTFKIEHPEVYYIDFPQIPTGFVSTRDVKDGIGLADYTTTSPSVSQEIAGKIKAYYQSQGYARAEIQAQEEDGVEPHSIHIVLDINEGPRIKVDKIEFTGVASKPGAFYEEILLSQTLILANHYYVKDELEKALKNLIIDRRNNGFFKAKILSTRTVFNEKKDAVSIQINLDEGPLTTVENISFEGNKQISSDILLNELNLKSKEPLKLDELENGISKIKKYYQDQGFLEMTLLNEKNENDEMVSYNQDNTAANIHFKIFEGPKIIVGSIAIEGNTITKDSVILKEIEFKQNDILTPALIEESKNRLQRVGIFSSVDIRTLETKTMISRRTVLIKVSDRDPGLRNAGLGFTNENDFTLRGYMGIAYRNLDGLARAASGRIDLNYNVPHIKFLEKKASVGYTQPYLFESRIKGRLNYTAAAYVSDFSSLKATQLTQGTGSLEQEITSHFLFRWDVLNLGTYEDFLIRTDATVNRVIIGSTGPTIELDYRDNQFNPTKGTYTRLSTEYASPNLASDSNIQFLRTLGSFTHNWNFYKRAVWANQIRGGYIQNYADLSIGGYVPWTQKGFLLGGQSTIRGFANGESFPNSTDLGNNFKLTSYASMYLFKSEFRFPLKGNIGGVIFYDGGAVTIDKVNLNYTYRHSVGFGLRYITPVGPVSAEIGWKLNPIGIRSESPFAMHLSIGTF